MQFDFLKSFVYEAVRRRDFKTYRLAIDKAQSILLGQLEPPPQSGSIGQTDTAGADEI